MNSKFKYIKQSTGVGISMRGKKRMPGQRGSTLVEVLISIAIVTIAGSALLLSLLLATKVLISTDSNETARDYAQAQMESIQNLPYDNGATTYPALTDLPAGYTIDIIVSAINTDVQKITITVTPGPNPPFELEGYKVNY